MTLSALLAAVELEQAREQNIRAARARVDAARDRHKAAQSLLVLLERRTKNARALKEARDDVDAARLELTRARRALIGAIA